MQKNCIVCSLQCQCSMSDTDEYSFECPRCGNFYVTKEAREGWSLDQSDVRKISCISGWIRENRISMIDSNMLQTIGRVKHPQVYEKAEKLLRYISKKTTHPGAYVTLNMQTTSGNFPYLLSIAWAYNYDEIRYLLDYLELQRFIVFEGKNCPFFKVQVTPQGFAYEAEIDGTVNSNLGFCAMWFDCSQDGTWQLAIEPAIKKAGYEAMRIDQHAHNEGVVDEILAQIRRSKFLIADFTGYRGGVYYEAGFARGLNKEVIFTCEKSYFEENEPHFDVKHYNFLLYKKEKLFDFRDMLAWRIESTLGRGQA